MKKTQKYIKATERLTFSHKNQEDLYQELNRIGYYWDVLKKEWLRDDRLALPPSQKILIRVWAGKDEVEEHADIIMQLLSQNGYTVFDKSIPYSCRPPKQNESRIYLSFMNKQN